MRRLLLVFAALTTAGVLAGALLAARGDLDPTFGSGGKVTTDFGGNEIGWAIALQRDGKAVVAGDRFDPGPADDVLLARYTANGRLDPSFDGDGKVTTDFNDRFSGAFGVAIQPDGKIVAAGYGFAPTGPQDFAVARYNADGSLDQTFGAGGRVLTTFGPNSIDGGGALALQPDGKILVGGRTRSGPTSDFWSGQVPVERRSRSQLRRRRPSCHPDQREQRPGLRHRGAARPEDRRRWGDSG